MGAIVEVHALLSGRVQGVSCRYNVQLLANQFKIAGFVQNLDDGRVEIIAQGDESVILAFLDAVKNLSYPIKIEKIEKAFKPLSRKFEGPFKII